MIQSLTLPPSAPFLSLPRRSDVAEPRRTGDTTVTVAKSLAEIMMPAHPEMLDPSRAARVRS